MNHFPTDLRNNLQSALAQLWGGPVKLSPLQVFENHEHVQRLRVEQAPAGAPATLILKQAREAFDPQADDFSSAAIFNEWASLEFLRELFGEDAPIPRLYAANRTAGWLALEDLGDGDPVLDALFGSDPQRASAQIQRFGEILGHLHSRARPHLAQFLQRRRALSRFTPSTPGELADFIPDSVQTLSRLLNIDLPPAALEDAHQAFDILTHSDDFVTFVHNDAAPNNLLEKDGRLCLYDFEAASWQPALLEGANLRMYFPTMGLKFTHRLPESAWRPAETAYRAALIEGCPAAANDAHWADTLVAACAYWTLAYVQGPLSIEWALTAEHPHLDHIRQCRLARFDTFAQTAAEFDRLPHLARFCTAVTTHLRARWPDAVEPLPLFPAFHQNP